MAARIVKLEKMKKVALVTQRAICQVQSTSGASPADRFVDRDAVLDTQGARGMAVLVQLWARHDTPARTSQLLWLQLEDAPDLCEESFADVLTEPFDLSTTTGDFPSLLQQLIVVDPLRPYIRHKLMECKNGGSTCSALVAYDLMFMGTE